MPTHVQEAWIITQQGLPKDALVLRNDHPIPSAEKGEVLVKLQAAALNPVIQTHENGADFLAKRPLVAGYDLAGVVEGPNDSDFTKGDAVFGYIPVPLLSMKRKEGALQQYASVPSDCLVIRPPNLSAIGASGLSLAGETAWQGLLEFGKLEAGQSVFINGGSSSVGAYAIQIAKAKGASRVVATASGKNKEFVRNLGADEFIDYTKQPLHEYLLQNLPSTKFDVIFDAVGLQEPDLYKNSPVYLAPGGAFVSVGPVVDSIYESKDALSAYERIMTSRAKGKIVVKVDFSVS